MEVRGRYDLWNYGVSYNPFNAQIIQPKQFIMTALGRSLKVLERSVFIDRWSLCPGSRWNLCLDAMQYGDSNYCLLSTALLVLFKVQLNYCGINERSSAGAGRFTGSHPSSSIR